MKVSLVSASTFEGVNLAAPDEPLDEDPPLGVLSLAAVLRDRGDTPVVCDLTEFVRSSTEPDRLCASAAEWVCAADADVFGFGTICSSYPFTLRLAAEVRRRRPGRPIVVGGPQATVTDTAVVEAFPCVDVVVRGEGERVLDALLTAWAGGVGLEEIAGITWRDGGRVRRNPDAPVITDLDSLPQPAFDLDPLLARRAAASVELGRGCPFACEFCSTNDFFRRKFRLKSPDRVVAEMRHLHDRYGHVRFNLVHDMFTVDRRRVIAFCDAMRRAGAGLRWSCSARTDCVDEALLERMAEAGCVGLFFGIESGAPGLQRRMGKHLDLEEARRHVASAARRGFATTVSMIIGFPEETPDELRESASFVMDAAREDGAEPQVHLLAPLAGTPLAHRCRDRLRLDPEIYSDASGSMVDRKDRGAEYALIAAHPDLFTNFYLVPTLVPARYLNEARLFLSRGLRRCRWLLVALDQEVGHIMDAFDAWLAWRQAPPALERYYHEQTFVRDLLAFVRENYARQGLPATGLLQEYFQALLDQPASSGAAPPGTRPAEAVGPGAIPIWPARSRLLRLSGSVPGVIERLRVRQPPSHAELSGTTPLFVRRTEPHWYHLTELREIPAAVLGWCDGSRRTEDVIDSFAASGLGIEGIPPDVVCRGALRYLGEVGLLRFVIAEGATPA